ncbi:MAG: hypothetical protein ACOX0L_09510 [Natronincolaceae bacterium]
MGETKKYAVIDIGTNSMRLLLAAIKKNHEDSTFGFTEHKKYINTTRIGSSIDKNKAINQKGTENNVKAFYDFVQRAKEYGADEILAIATSAIREAKNRNEFIQAIYQKTGINIKIVSGEEEAELGYKGVIMGLKCHSGTENHGDGTPGRSFLARGPVPVVLARGPVPVVFPVVFPECRPDKDSVPRYRDGRPCPSSEAEGGRGLVPRCRGDLRHSGVGSSCVMHPNDTKGPSPCVILVIDIGGGSTELTLGTRNGDVKETISLDIGAVRMTEKFITTDPVGKEEYEKMKTAINETIKNHGVNSFPAPPASLTAVGIGGTITTLAALHQELDPYDPERVHNYRLTPEDINNLKEKLLSLTIQQIRQLKGIHPKRADIIVAGITILSVIMDSLNLKEIIVSEYDNLEGLLYNEM